MSPKTKTVPSGRKRTISGYERERRYLESLIRTDYERGHPNDSFEDLKRRSIIPRERHPLDLQYIPETGADTRIHTCQ
jgi:hypothetical protein